MIVKGKDRRRTVNKTPAEKQDRLDMALTLFLAFVVNQGVYLAARGITWNWHHYDMTTLLDEKIPFLPWTVSVYFGCYLFWCVNYYLCARQKKEERDRFFCADFWSKGICFFLFLLLPTTNIRPEIWGASVWEKIMCLLYWVDAPDNLFPSIHCLVSWLCWIGVRKRKEIPVAYRWFSLIFAAAVCLSTLTTRQHVTADVFGGILLAEISYGISRKPQVRRPHAKIISLMKKWILQRKKIPGEWKQE